jgi:membrane protease YdiL (CAAX protease family)
MWRNYLTKTSRAARLVIWVALTFFGAQFIVAYAAAALLAVVPAIAAINDSVFVTIYAACSYTLAVTLAVGIPWWLKRPSTTEQLGIKKALSWLDIGIGTLGYIPYFIVAMPVTALVVWLLPSTATQQMQDIPFHDLARGFEFFVAFMTLIVLAPLAEELLFRGYLFGKLRSFLPVWVVIVVTALAFGSMHLPGSGGLQWLVAADTFALGLVLGYMRYKTGSIWAGVVLHALKNSIAFYFLFINPSILGML